MQSLDFKLIATGQVTIQQLASGKTQSDFLQLTTDVFATIDDIVAEITDDDVNFVPEDKEAREGDECGWTLSHIIAHLTATLEERAAFSSLLARGIAIEARLHSEVPWESIKTVQQLRARLNESQRITKAYLQAWPDEPRLDVEMTLVPRFGPMNAISSYMLGIVHAQVHFEQMRDVVRQSRAARM